MGEYQYYEFAAVERPLTAAEQAELGGLSSRAVITPGSFVNAYHWGDLNGDQDDWVRRYFDAHVYSAGWAACRFVLKLPRHALDEAVLAPCLQPPASGVKPYFMPAFQAEASDAHWLLTWGFNDDSGDIERFWGQTDGPGWMSRLLPLREELLRGDWRPLYLGWLARVSQGELDDTDLEPPVPPGLATLTPAQEALVEFLLVENDWLVAAAVNSGLAASPPPAPDYDAWLAARTADELRPAIRLLLEGRGAEAERSARQAYASDRRIGGPPPAEPAPRRRNVAALRAAAQVANQVEIEWERQMHAEIAATMASQRAALRARLVANGDQVWEEIDQTLRRGTGAAYDDALRIAKELAVAFREANRYAEFQHDLRALMEVHGKRPAWKSRVDAARLY